jgi:hypothetical protein
LAATFCDTSSFCDTSRSIEIAVNAGREEPAADVRQRSPDQGLGTRTRSLIKDAYWKTFDTADLRTPPGPKLTELMDARISEMAAIYGPTYPSAMKCLTTDREGLTAYLRFPAEHHHRIRHSNFVERTFGETRRRTKVIGRLGAAQFQLNGRARPLCRSRP